MLVLNASLVQDAPVWGRIAPQSNLPIPRFMIEDIHHL
jgi:hypothetical protein